MKITGISVVRTGLPDVDGAGVRGGRTRIETAIDGPVDRVEVFG